MICEFEKNVSEGGLNSSEKITYLNKNWTQCVTACIWHSAMLLLCVLWHSAWQRVFDTVLRCYCVCYVFDTVRDSVYLTQCYVVTACAMCLTQCVTACIWHSAILLLCVLWHSAWQRVFYTVLYCYCVCYVFDTVHDSVYLTQCYFVTVCAVTQCVTACILHSAILLLCVLCVWHSAWQRVFDTVLCCYCVCYVFDTVHDSVYFTQCYIVTVCAMCLAQCVTACIWHSAMLLLCVLCVWHSAWQRVFDTVLCCCCVCYVFDTVRDSVYLTQCYVVTVCAVCVVTVLLLLCHCWRPRVEVCVDSICHSSTVQFHWLRDPCYSSCITGSVQVITVDLCANFTSSTTDFYWHSVTLQHLVSCPVVMLLLLEGSPASVVLLTGYWV